MPELSPGGGGWGEDDLPPARTDLTPVDDAAKLAETEEKLVKADLGAVHEPEPPPFQAGGDVPEGQVAIVVPSEVAKTVVKVLDAAAVDTASAINQLQDRRQEIEQTRLDRIQMFTIQARAALLRDDLS